jgi:hypothetical protein
VGDLVDRLRPRHRVLLGLGLQQKPVTGMTTD